MSKHTILTEVEIEEALVKLPEWSVEEGRLCAKFTFTNFSVAIDFINKIASVAEDMDHHPEFCNSYNNV